MNFVPRITKGKELIQNILSEKHNTDGRIVKRQRQFCFFLLLLLLLLTIKLNSFYILVSFQTERFVKKGTKY